MCIHVYIWGLSSNGPSVNRSQSNLIPAPDFVFTTHAKHTISKECWQFVPTPRKSMLDTARTPNCHTMTKQNKTSVQLFCNLHVPTIYPSLLGFGVVVNPYLREFV